MIPTRDMAMFLKSSRRNLSPFGSFEVERGGPDGMASGANRRVKNNSKNIYLGAVTIVRQWTILRKEPLTTNSNEGGRRGSRRMQLAKQGSGTPERQCTTLISHS